MNDFFSTYGVWTLIFLACFPRLTLLFGSFMFGGVWWWLGWIFAPHWLIAILSLPFYESNPVLVIIAWTIAFFLSIETGKSAHKRNKKNHKK